MPSGPISVWVPRFKSSTYFEYACGLKRGTALILEPNPIFEIAYLFGLRFRARVILHLPLKRFRRYYPMARDISSPTIFENRPGLSSLPPSLTTAISSSNWLYAFNWGLSRSFSNKFLILSTTG